MMLLRTFCAVSTIIAAALVAANWNARVMVAGFAIFIVVASIAQMVDGWLENKASLIIQNAILLLINILGVWRWLPRDRLELAHPSCGTIGSRGTLEVYGAQTQGLPDIAGLL
jgi:hypothetical protein